MTRAQMLDGVPKVKREVWFLQCTRCEHEWYPRSDKPPTCCPKCKSPYWSKPRKKRA